MRQSRAKTLDLANSRGPTHLNFEKPDDNDTVLDESNDVTDSCLVVYSGWIVLTPRMQFVNCPLTSVQLPLEMKSTSSVCFDI